MITRDEAKKLADELIFTTLLQTALIPNAKGWSEVDALCYAFSACIMAKAFPGVDPENENFTRAVAAQAATLACAIDAGALSKQYIYDSYVDLVQEANEENNENRGY
ncbi:hypothetical protein [Lactobacillus delbrueckii]|uniref:hypothetical protein n=1 Tax=Lactobacillus delbrueckii TaxID=1584 RepID=UPI003A86B35C